MLLSPAEENPFLQKSSRSLLNNVCHANSPGDATTQQLGTQHHTAVRLNHGKTWKVRKWTEDTDTVPCGSSANHHEKPVLSTRLSAVANSPNKTTQPLDRSEAISYTPELIARPPIQSTEAPILVDSNSPSSSTPSSSTPSSSTPSSSTPSSSFRTKNLPNSDDLSGKVSDARLQTVDTSQNHTSANRELSNEHTAFGLSPSHTQPSPNPHPPEASLPSVRDLPSDLDNVPIQIKIGSAESKKYELRSFAKKAGLYYSCAVWPEELPHRNRSFVFGRLRTDLNNYIMRASKEKKKKREMKKGRIALTEQAFTLELRLSGRVSTNKEDLELRPTIWTVCASGFYMTLVEEALTQCQLSWIADEPIEVVKGLSFNKQRARIAGLDLSKGFHFTDSYQVHLHVEEPGEDNSACGLVVCATITKDGNIIDQCVSRLGGLIQINDQIVCASTAHGILDMLIAARLVPTTQEDSPGDNSHSDNESEAESDSTAATDPESDSDSVIQYSDTDDTYPELTGNPTISSITRWHTVPKAVIFDFVRAALPNPHNQSWTLGVDARAHDFALFKLWPDLLGKLHNSYGCGSNLRRVTEYMRGNFLPSKEEIMVLLGHNTFVPGKVLPGKSKIYMAGVEFTTKRIVLHRPLASGTSGSWVISGGSLYGIIIASYGQEPIAHMITAQQFFRDIESALPRISYVNLPILEEKSCERFSLLLMHLAEGRRAAEIIVPSPSPIPHRPSPVYARPSMPSPPPSPPPSLGANQPLNPPPVSQADQNRPYSTLHVGNLPMDTSEDELKAIFSKQSGYKRLCFRTKQNGLMCFVEFDDISSATKALHNLNGQPLRTGVKGGICISFSKNPLGVRSALSKAPDDHRVYKDLTPWLFAPVDGYIEATVASMPSSVTR